MATTTLMRLGVLGVALVLAACGSGSRAGGPGKDEAKAETNDGEREAEGAAAPGDVGDAPLANGQPSLEALGKAVVGALNTKDDKALAALSVTETEYHERLFGALANGPQALRLGPTVAWANQAGDNREAVAKALEQHGGKGYAFVSLEPTGKEERKDLVIYRDPTLTVKDRSGATVEVRVLGVVVEHVASGTFLVLTYAD